MAFLTEPKPEPGQAVTMAPGIRRIVASNPGPMTYHGTNTYLLDGADGVTVLDPGPDQPAHREAVLAAAGKVSRILVSHSHSDHVDGLAAMRAATGAPVFAHAGDLAPDRLLVDGDDVFGWTVLHTPGHAPDHLCFARADGVVLSADHVMGWSSTVVSPPLGDMVAYFGSLRRMLEREDRIYLPGHGPVIAQPRTFVRFLLDHRLGREAAILRLLAAGPTTPASLVQALYVGLAPHLRPAAERSVLAHLIKLAAEGAAAHLDDTWLIPAARPGLAG